MSIVDAKLAGGKNRFPFSLVSLLLIASFLLAACCGGGGHSSTDNGNGTVTDHVTHRMWQKQDNVISYTWDAAITYCEGLTLAGFSDWRVPSPKELESIPHDAVYFPSINTTFFRVTAPSNYWWFPASSRGTPSPWYAGFFGLQCVGPFLETSYGYVRCVRLGQ